MRIEGARALVMRLIVGEVLARPGEGPLARRALARGRIAQEVGSERTSAHEREAPKDDAP